MKHKTIYYTLLLLQVIFTGMIYYWYTLKDAKMGIVRHITFWNTYKFPKLLSDKIIYLILLLSIVFLIIHILKILNYSLLRKIETFMLLFLVILQFYFTLTSSVSDNFIYYYVIIYFTLMVICQFFKIFSVNQ